MFFVVFFFFFKFNRENESFRLKISTENSKMLEIEKSWKSRKGGLMTSKTLDDMSTIIYPQCLSDISTIFQQHLHVFVKMSTISTKRYIIDISTILMIYHGFLRKEILPTYISSYRSLDFDNILATYH